MKRPKSLLQKAIDRARGRNGWWFYHFDESHIADPYRRVPLRQVMMADAARVMYQPIAKNACSSLKTLVAGLGGMPPLGPEDDIHAILDAGPNPHVLLHRDQGDITQMLESPDWMRFAVLREPLDRLVSVYLEKFVLNRTQPGVRITIDPVLIRVLDRDRLRPEDYQSGITFRQFAEDLLNEPPERLDPHWRPQVQYLEGISYTHLYTVDTLGTLSGDLEAHVGKSIDLPHKNATRGARSDGGTGACVADLMPAEIAAEMHIDSGRFFDPSLRARLGARFALDTALYSMALKLNREQGSGALGL